MSNLLAILVPLALAAYTESKVNETGVAPPVAVIMPISKGTETFSAKLSVVPPSISISVGRSHRSLFLYLNQKLNHLLMFHNKYSKQTQ